MIYKRTRFSLIPGLLLHALSLHAEEAPSPPAPSIEAEEAPSPPVPAIGEASHQEPASSASPTATVHLNLGQTFWHVVGASFFVEPKLVYVPIPIEGSFRLSKQWGVSATVHYRYENYEKGNSSRDIWHNHHEVFVMVGPRLSWNATGLEGLYTNLQVGIGYAQSPAPYSYLSVVVQPKVGYTWVWGSSGLSLGVGAGVLINTPLWEEPTMLLGSTLTTVGYLCHRYIPVLEASVGFGL